MIDDDALLGAGIVVDGEEIRDACWTYPEPAAEDIRGRVAFWKGVLVEE